jgi:hypothetical protein
MSLPSQARFHLNDGTTKDASCNIGWYFQEEFVPRTVRDAQEFAKLTDTDWHSVSLYGLTYTKKQLNEIIMRKVNLEDKCL